MILFAVLLSFIAITVALAVYFVRTDHGEKEPIGALWIAFGFGVFGALLAAGIENFLIPAKDLNAGAPISTLIITALGIGAIEEACKFIPLSLFIYHKRYFNEHTDGIIYFALAGLGFGLPENVLYTLQFGASTGLGRLLLTPLFHAATTGMVGYFLINAKLAHRTRLRPWLVLVIAAAIHALYDFGLASGLQFYNVVSVMVTLGMTVALFALYWHARDLDQQAGLSAVGRNNFCRSCGHKNPEHNLYCAHCGQRA